MGEIAFKLDGLRYECFPNWTSLFGGDISNPRPDELLRVLMLVRATGSGGLLVLALLRNLILCLDFIGAF